jgi:hypothetical protein
LAQFSHLLTRSGLIRPVANRSSSVS